MLVDGVAEVGLAQLEGCGLVEYLGLVRSIDGGRGRDENELLHLGVARRHQQIAGPLYGDLLHGRRVDQLPGRQPRQVDDPVAPLDGLLQRVRVADVAVGALVGQAGQPVELAGGSQQAANE
jgi:hypothetical protein